MFTLDECKKIISYSETYRLKTVNGGYPGYNKIQYSGWDIKYDSETKWAFDIIYGEFTKQTGLELISKPNSFSLHKYVSGEMFEKHNDVNDPKRIWNIGTNLNDDYQGGNFILYDPEIILDKTPGKIYTFESIRHHEVKEITSGERWSLLMFIWHDHIKKQKLL